MFQSRGQCHRYACAPKCLCSTSYLHRGGLRNPYCVVEHLPELAHTEKFMFVFSPTPTHQNCEENTCQKARTVAFTRVDRDTAKVRLCVHSGKLQYVTLEPLPLHSYHYLKKVTAIKKDRAAHFFHSHNCTTLASWITYRLPFWVVNEFSV